MPGMDRAPLAPLRTGIEWGIEMSSKKKGKPRRSGGSRPSIKGGGIFSSMRGGMKGLVGTGKAKKKKKKSITFIDVLLFLLLLVLAGVVINKFL